MVAQPEHETKMNFQTSTIEHGEKNNSKGRETLKIELINQTVALRRYHVTVQRKNYNLSLFFCTK